MSVNRSSGLSQFVLYLGFGFLESIFHRALGVHQHCAALLQKVVDHRPGFRVVGLEPFLDDFQIVIHSSAGFSSFEEPFCHALLPALEDDDEGDQDVGVHAHVPLPQVLVISWESVDQEFPLFKPFSPHLCFQQLDCDFAGHNSSLNHALLDELPMRTIFLLPLLPQQISSRHVMEPEVLLDELALSAFSGAGSSQDEVHAGLEVTRHRLVGLHADLKSSMLKLLNNQLLFNLQAMLDIQTAKKYDIQDQLQQNLASPYFREETTLWPKNDSASDRGCPPATKRYPFTKLAKNFGVDITRFLSISGSRLYYFQTPDSSLCLGSCQLENVYMRWLPCEENFLLLLSNGTESSCYCFSQDAFYVENQGTLALFTVQLDFYNQFQLLEELGEGAFSTAYRVVHIKSGQQFTAKTLPLDSPKTFIIRELEVLRSLVGGQHVSQFWGLFENGEHLVLVTKFVEGRDLMTVINYKGGMTWTEVRTIVRGIARGLKVCHQKRIVHRDLKPQNVVVNLDTMEATIIDFGMALDLKKECEFKKCGTLAYMAPEVFHCEQKSLAYNTKSDWFSLGVIAHLLMVGENPLRRTLPTPFDRTQPPQCNQQLLRNKWGDPAFLMVTGLMSENPCRRWGADKLLGCCFMLEGQQYKNSERYSTSEDRLMVGCS